MADINKLVQQARLARTRAKAPYSGYAVGAALLTKSGSIFLGCNVESGAYPTTMCAERVAIYNAIAAGEDEITALAIVTNDGGTPCGSCRQVIHEQCGDIPVYLVNESDGGPVKYQSSELLPYPFDLNER